MQPRLRQAGPAGGRLEIAGRWTNEGVAPCYGGGNPAFTLKTPSGAIMLTFVDEQFDVRNLAVAAPGEAPPAQQRLVTQVPGNVAPGQYELFVSVGSVIGTAVIGLPIDGDDGQRRYRLGTITILEPDRSTAEAWWRGYHRPLE